MIKEFKEFVTRGNVLDLAVAVIIGGAFGKIVASLVADVFMPPIGVLTGGVDFTDMSVSIKDAVMDGTTVVSPEVVISYGKFINEVFTFTIVAFAVFMMIRALNKVQKKAEAAPAAPSKEELLLTDIRDLLKSQAK